MDYAAHYSGLLTDLLFEKDIKVLAEMQLSLQERNYALGNPKDGFLYAGRFHSTLEPRAQHKALKKQLHRELHDNGEAYITRSNRFTAERTRVFHGLQIFLKPCRSLQDVRDVLPDSVAMIRPEFAKVPRDKPTGWPFEGKPMAMHQYQDISALLEFYVVNRILY